MPQSLPGDSNGFDDLFVRDRLLGTTDRVSVGTDGAQGDRSRRRADLPRRPLRRVPDLSSTLLGPGGDTNGINDIYVRDRLVNVTKRVSVAYDGDAVDASRLDGFAISGDGRPSRSTAPTEPPPPGTDTNGKSDLFVRGVDGSRSERVDTLLFDNNRLDRRGARALDTGTNTLRTLCPATQVARSRRHGGVPAARVGGRHGGLSGRLVERRRRRRRHRRRALARQRQSAEPRRRGDGRRHVARRSPRSFRERGQNNTILNGDGDRNDTVVEVHPATVAGAWTNTGQAADALQVCGPRPCS
jgi:hypothetical protein